MNPTGPTERSVEHSLRELLVPLDRHLERGRSLLAAALALSPAPCILLWLIGTLEAKHAAGWAVLTFAGLVVAGLGWEMLMDRVVRWRFDRCFPPGTAIRETALRLLGQIELPNKVEEKLREALGVRREPGRRPGFDPINEPPLLELPPEKRPEPPAAVPAAAPRRGGYYDYIPLEPLPSERQPDADASATQ